MPAKKTVSKEMIIEAALGIVRKSGMDGLNMRTLAKECKCSTQPLYLSFKNAESIKAEVADRIFKIYLKYRDDEIARAEFPAYKATGMAYIRFAQEEKEFFKYLFMRNRAGESAGKEEADFADMKNFVSANYGLQAKAAGSLHTHMWIWVHGIAAMYATGFLDWDRQTVSDMLTEIFLALKYRIG